MDVDLDVSASALGSYRSEVLDAPKGGVRAMSHPVWVLGLTLLSSARTVVLNH